MTLRSKILAILLIATALLSSFSFILIQSIDEMNNVSDSISNETIPELVWISHWEEQLSVKEYMIKNGIENHFCCEFIESYEAYILEASEHMASEHGQPPPEMDHIQREMDLLDFMILNNIQGLITFGDIQSATEYVEEEYLNRHSEMRGELESAKDEVILTMESHSERFLGIIRESLILLLIVTIAIIIFSIAASYRISKSLTSPVEKMEKKLDQIAKGEFGLQIDDTDQVELKSLTTSINHMSCELQASFEAIMNGKKYHEQILNSLPIGIITSDERSENFTLNLAAKQLLKKEDGEVTAIGNEEGNQNNFFWDNLLSMDIFQNVKVPFYNKEKRYVFLISQTKLMNREGQVIGKIFYFLDITETEELEKKINQTEKLALVGELSAGAAHEIRNPLAVIDGFLSLMNHSLPEEHKNRFHLPLLKKELERINSIIEEMLMLTKPSAPKLKEVYLGTVIQDILPLLQGTLDSKGISIHVQLGEVRLFMDTKQIKQVFHNLIRNSMEAMGENGDIWIYSSVDDKEYSVYIQDSGIGISKKMRKSLFDPFQTSKQQGTGLGLTIAQRILDNHNGKLELHSTSNKGTTFLLTFPRSQIPIV